MKREDELFSDMAPFEARFFRDLIRSYSTLDLDMRRFFYHRIQEIVRDAIELLRERQRQESGELRNGGAN
jgi:hypothetical protein